MVKNRRKVYCCRQHADDHFNLKRREKKMSASPGVETATIEENDTMKQVEPSALAKEVAVSPAQQTELVPAQSCEDRLLQNLIILDGIRTDPVNGTPFKFDFLLKKGFDFSTSTSSMPIHNIPDGKHSNWIQYERYRLYRIDKDTVLIKNMNHS